MTTSRTKVRKKSTCPRAIPPLGSGRIAHHGGYLASGEVVDAQKPLSLPAHEIDVHHRASDVRAVAASFLHSSMPCSVRAPRRPRPSFKMLTAITHADAADGDLGRARRDALGLLGSAIFSGIFGFQSLQTHSRISPRQQDPNDRRAKHTLLATRALARAWPPILYDEVWLLSAPNGIS